MRLKLFRAATLPMAMAQLRAELGEDALILSTRRTAQGVELTAALEVEPQPVPALPDSARLQSLRFHGVPERLLLPLACGGPEDAVAAALRFGRLPDSPLLLAGPAGAGKTLTLVRLAARAVMSGQAPMIIAADGERAGASEQLAAYARVLGARLIEATDPLILARAVAARAPGTPVLIDTPGINPFRAADQARIAALGAVASAASVLVLPAGMDAGEAADTASAFAAAGAVALVATRLDVARRLGGVLAAATSLPLAELGIGPGAADGLVPATPALLAARLAPPPLRKAA